MINRLFLDSSVLISASASNTGASALTLMLCSYGKIQGIVSDYVIKESSRNIANKLNEDAYKRFVFYLKNCGLVICPSFDKLLKAVPIASKDQPIVQAAICSGVEYLITLDKKDFFKENIIEYLRQYNIRLMRPGDFISAHRELLD